MNEAKSPAVPGLPELRSRQTGVRVGNVGPSLPPCSLLSRAPRRRPSACFQKPRKAIVVTIWRAGQQARVFSARPASSWSAWRSELVSRC